jgi:hypothetical protein
VILSKFWSRYDLQNFREQKFLGDDQGELSNGTVQPCVHKSKFSITKFRSDIQLYIEACIYCTGQPIPNMPNFGHISTPLFLEDEDIFQKSARVVLILLQFRLEPHEPIFELHL